MLPLHEQPGAYGGRHKQSGGDEHEQRETLPVRGARLQQRRLPDLRVRNGTGVGLGVHGVKSLLHPRSTHRVIRGEQARSPRSRVRRDHYGR